MVSEVKVLTLGGNYSHSSGLGFYVLMGTELIKGFIPIEIFVMIFLSHLAILT